MRPVLASILVLLALPATAAAQTALPPLEYAAPVASISRGAPLTFAVRTTAPDGTVVVRVSGHDDVDDDGLLTGPDGTWLDETATQATADLAVWSVPAELRPAPAARALLLAGLPDRGRRDRRRGADRTRPGADGDAAVRRQGPRQAVPEVRPARA